ncbi:hypothetical protein OG196_14155 [Kitasatospora purpeofusca]|uniref:hypothetical protein n=1 Tax=Kitasatospora purpeofusca TaxID=67352 RepID=UPI002E111DD7|nr:hypothetical protein OG196_14155 [Kitasatospora purpeofusca]
MTYDTPLNPLYAPFAEAARARRVPFHVSTTRRGCFLHLHLTDGPTLELGDDGVGGAAATKPGGTTGFTLQRTLPGGHVNRIYDSTPTGPHHANGTNPAPLLAVLDRFLPPPPAPKAPRKARHSLLRSLLRFP